MVALRRFRNPGPSFADLVPYAGLVADGVILLKDGSLMAGWYFAGPDSESSTNQERNGLPPLKWSSIKYGFEPIEERRDGQETAHCRRDCSEAASG